MTTDNIYSAPTASMEERPTWQNGGDSTIEKFYVVARWKFVLLFLFTGGFYQIYWFYRNWSNYKAYSGEDDIWPAPRGLFSIFFVNALFRRVDETLVENDIDHSWYPQGYAVGYIICELVINVIDRMPNDLNAGNGLLWVQLLLMFPVVGKILHSAQYAINIACGDPKGESNSRLTLANWTWLVLGGIFLVLLLTGAFFVK